MLCQAELVCSSLGVRERISSNTTMEMTSLTTLM